MSSLHALSALAGNSHPASSSDRRQLLPTILLHELQHRTANVLNLASLQLEVQARRSVEGPARRALLDIARDFRQLVLAQQRLVVADVDAVADAGREVRDTVEALARGFAGLHPGLTFECSVDPAADIAVRPAGVLALIVGELVTNAVKHAYVGRDGGLLHVVFRATPSGQGRLSVIDDGPGFDPGLRGGSGLGIVRMFASVIDGELKVERQPGSGARVSVVFAPAS